MPTISWRCATAGSRPSRSRPGWRRGWRPEGLGFNEDKTKIVHLEEGSRLPRVQRPPLRQSAGRKLLIKPSQEAVEAGPGTARRRDARPARGQRSAVIRRLNPIIRGWSAYYRSVVSSRVFAALDHHVWHLTYRWARHTHPNKSKGWVVARYFGRFNRARLTGGSSATGTTGAYLSKFSWTRIVRHVPVGEGRHPTTQPWPSTGLSAGAHAVPRRWISTPSSCLQPKGTAAPPAGTRCSTPMMNRSPQHSGNSGSWPPEGRCANSASSSKRTPRPANDGPTDSSTPPVNRLTAARQEPSVETSAEPSSPLWLA